MWVVICGSGAWWDGIGYGVGGDGATVVQNKVHGYVYKFKRLHMEVTQVRVRVWARYGMICTYDGSA
jgi:hypothetical protein